MRTTIFTILLIITLLSGCNNKNNNHKQVNQDISDEQLIKINKYLVEKDHELINAYVKRRNWDCKVTGSGLWYMIYENGTGKMAAEGNIAEIKYKVELLDGTLCYSSDKLGTKKFVIGKGNVEPGLEEGILLLKEGDKARFIMPSYLAHHLTGDDNKIPARAIIVYQVELLKISDN